MNDPRTVICTIVAKNYLAQARTLMRSVQAFQPDVRRVVLVVDPVEGYFDPFQEPFDVLLGQALSIRDWSHFTMKYNVLELCTAVKPFLLKYLFEVYDAQKIIYFDPDIVVYHSLDLVLQLLNQSTAILTPHILQPLQDSAKPGEFDLLQLGTFNLGFFGIARRGQWRELLAWWAGKLYSGCVVDPEHGYFVDQHWCDLLPSLFEDVFILRDPGHNVAYWNLTARSVAARGSQYSVDGVPLVFFHFSGYSPDTPDLLSKHGGQVSLQDIGPAYRGLFDDYRAQLDQHGYSQTCKWPYSYAAFPDGVSIPDELRVCLRATDPQAERWPNPYDIAGPDSFRQWATRPLPDGTRLTPLALAVYQSQPDLQRAFPHLWGSYEDAFLHWLTDPSRSQALHPFYSGKHKKREILLRGKVNASESFGSRTGTGRLFATISYFIHYRAERQRRQVADASNSLPAYILPGGLYGRVARTLKRLGLIQLTRKLIGVRAISTLRFMLGYPPSPFEFVAEASSSPDMSNAPAAPVQTGLASPTPPTQRSVDSQPGVNVVGYLHSESGVGQVARSLVRSLNAAGVPLAVRVLGEHDPARQNDTWADQFDNGSKYGINVFAVNANMAFPTFESLGSHVYKGCYNVGYWAWELASFPERWQECFALYDEIWTLSSFEQVAIAAKSPVPVVRIPVSIDLPTPDTLRRTDFGLPHDACVFFFSFDALSRIERKNPWAVIDAFEQAFSTAERKANVRLLIKTTNLSRFPEDEARLRRRMEQVNGVLLDTYLNHLEVYGLMDMCDAYVSLHRAEGFGLTIAEAMFLGKPVIATAYSGNTDFMTPMNSYLIPYRLETLAHDVPPYDAGQAWACPDINAAAASLRHVYNNLDEAKKRGEQAATDIRQSFSPVAVGQLINQRLRIIRTSQKLRW